MEEIFVNPIDLDACASAAARARARLDAGGLVVFPTETVYGIAARADQPRAIARLRALRGGAEQTPFTLHLGGGGAISTYIVRPSHRLRRIVRRSMPGPLTVHCTDIGHAALPEWAAFSRDGGITFRAPDHLIAKAMLSRSEVPVVAIGAAKERGPAATDAASARQIVEDAADLLLDGGPTQFQRPSTVIEFSGETWRVLREGALPERILRRRSEAVVLFVCTGNSCRSPLAEYLFRRELRAAIGDDVDLAEAGFVVQSAGTSAFGGGPASEGTLRELEARGIDASHHHSQPITPELLQQASHVYTMTEAHREVVLSIAPGLSGRVELLDPTGAIADPVGGGPGAYAAAAQQIERAVQQRVKEYLDEDRRWE